MYRTLSVTSSQQIADGTRFGIHAEWSEVRCRGDTGLTERTAVYAVYTRSDDGDGDDFVINDDNDNDDDDVLFANVCRRWLSLQCYNSGCAGDTVRPAAQQPAPRPQ